MPIRRPFTRRVNCGVSDRLRKFATRLARYFGGDAQSWLNLQTLYDLRVAERTSARKIEREIVPAEDVQAA